MTSSLGFVKFIDRYCDDVISFLKENNISIISHYKAHFLHPIKRC